MAVAKGPLKGGREWEGGREGGREGGKAKLSIILVSVNHTVCASVFVCTMYVHIYSG